MSSAAADAPDTSRFARQLQLARDTERPGRYRTTIDPEWNCPLVPHGGLVTAVAARAMGRELGNPDQPLRSITAVFAGQVRPGPVEIDVAVLRRGRSMSQLTATLRNAGEPAGNTTMAVFGRERPGFAFTDLPAPTAPPPERCPSFRDPVPGIEERLHFNFWDHVEGRHAVGHTPFDEYEPTSSERMTWYRFEEPPYVDGGVLDPLALVTLCDTMPGAVRERMGNGGPYWLPPSADLTVHLLGEARSDWLLGRNRARHAGEGYASVELELWDPGHGLVAYATQLMFFTFPEGPPDPPVQPAPR